MAVQGGGKRWAGMPVPALVVTAIVAGLIGGLIGWFAGASIAAARTGAPLGSPSVCPATTVAQTGLPSIVTIAARAPGGAAGGTGSGEVIAPGGMILTNDHVIAVAVGGGALEVRYSDGHSSPATIVGRDPLTDLAVLKAADGAPGLPIIARGSSRNLTVGQPVVALGAPLGLYGTVTAGIISALNRNVALPAAAGQSAHLVGAIQTDASINPGNSGGALVDCAARLIGVNTAIATVPNEAGQSGGGSVGLGFAIAVDVAMPIAEELIADGNVTHYTAGMDLQPIPPLVAQRAGIPQGLVVTAVAPAGPAAAAGMAVGDVVVAINGEAASNPEQLTVAELGARNGNGITVVAVRAGKQTSVSITPTRAAG